MRFKSERGAISLFMFIAVLFFTSFLLLMYAKNSNKLQTVTEKIDFVESIYERNVNNIDEVYNKQLAKNDTKQPVINEIPSTINIGETEIKDSYVEYGNLGGNTEFIYNNTKYDSLQKIINDIENSGTTGNVNFKINAYGNNGLTTNKSVTIKIIVPIPNEYQQVEHIEGTGTQYLNIGFIPTINTKIEADIQIREANKNINMNLFGAAPSDSKEQGSQYIVINSWRENMLEIRGFGSDWVKATIYSKVTDKINIKISKFNLIVDGLQVYSFNNPQATINNPLLIFRRNITGGGFGKMLLYKFKVWDNDILVRNMIPCYRKLDNVIGMYDTVNNVFYMNEGTGEFLKGPNV